jgi:hypothetical protein
MRKRSMFAFLVVVAVLICLQPARAGTLLLQVNSENDDPALRAAIAGFLGPGSAVDYFDSRLGTPTLAQLSAYDAVSTWTNGAHADRVLLGDTMAAYVDAGGRVILSVFSTYTTGNSLGGQIMTSGYSPVTSPGGTNHFSADTYAGDGTLFYSGVTSLSAIYRDYLVTQGGGVVDGTYADGEILVAYRPDFQVFYMNGNGNSVLGSSGDWAQLEANLAGYEGGAIPEPSTLALCLLGLAALVAVRQRSRNPNA